MLQFPVANISYQVGSCTTEDIPIIPVKRAPIGRISESNLSDDDASVYFSSAEKVRYFGMNQGWNVNEITMNCMAGIDWD
jgi:hypothetical protein